MLKLKKHHFKFRNKFSYSKHITKFSNLGFKVIQTKIISNKQEDFLKLLIIKILKKASHKKIKVLFYSNCFYNQTKLPLESRMGKGKGEICYSFGYYKVGYILFELKGSKVSEAINLKKQLNKKNILKLSLIN